MWSSKSWTGGESVKESLHASRRSQARQGLITLSSAVYHEIKPKISARISVDGPEGSSSKI